MLPDREPDPPPPPGRVVLVTGAAGGLGQGLVAAFRAAGWRVAAGWHRLPPAGDDPAVLPVPLEVRCADACHAAVDTVLARWGRIDALLHSAGVSADAALPRLRDTDWQHVLDVNLKGAFLCARAVAPAMVRQRDGHIVNIGSFTARIGAAGLANYTAAKAGLIGLTQSLARELGPRNVRANVLLPGVLPTPLVARLGEAHLATMAAANCLGRLSTIAEVARCAVFLAGTAHISGQLFQLDSRIAPWT